MNSVNESLLPSGEEERLANEHSADETESVTRCGKEASEEDNLHGLSIAPRSSATEETTHLSGDETNKELVDNEIILENLVLDDAATQRTNPFNTNSDTDSISQPISQENILPLDNYTQLEDDVIHSPTKSSPRKLERRKEPMVARWELSEFSSAEKPKDLSPENVDENYPKNDLGPATSDPWVRLSPTTEEPTSNHNYSPEPHTTPDEDTNTHATQFELMPKLMSKSKLKLAPAIEIEQQPSSLDPLIINVPGPCEPEDLIEGIIFSANYLGTTQLTSERNPSKNTRMSQAQEAVHRIKAPDGESQPTVVVDLFISTSKLKILNSETQETMMEHTLRSISYIADVGDLLVIMAKRVTAPDPSQRGKPSGPQRVICHILSSPDSHLMAESIGQCFQVAYQQFLQSNCIEPQSLTQDDYNNILDTQEMYHDDLVHYSKQENVKEIWIEKKKGENMGIAIVESGWGSIIPTVILANLQHGSPMERNGKFGIGDQIMSVNNTSLVGLPLATCQSIIKGLRNQTLVKFKIVSCPPVVTVLIKRPDLQHQLGFSVQNGIICSLMRGGIAERGGVRVGHRIIEINNQSVVATPHDKIVQTLVTSVGEIQMKTMPAAMYRLLTGQEQPLYL